ncbi:aromatic ring-hydroxylating dioxygenase subunit alpha [Solimonas flava]|uniref:aromatic ring-hydroxylating dioxygenase subunit alpha n=1 Tax=Solimonas flava TaxID=415849 RepID=UPI00042A9292|nr:aromatic ring-hydroxylating dioxygenase subunit alpha [Solimonas flava]
MNREDNELITRIGPGSAAGAVLRQYWQPAALVDELDGPRPVRPVTLLGESLVLFRDEQGRYGLVDRRCSHRGADLCYGRLENGGLRCPFHGWLFDVDGHCLEQPAEPEGSTLHERIRHRAYPCVERGGIIFAYLGEGEPPAFPDFDCFRAPDSHTFAFKGQWDCNWLQALEIGIDPAHASYLHRFFEDEDPRDSYGKQFRASAADTAIPLTQVLRDYARPEIRTEPTGYGLRIVTTRRLPQEQTHYRITNLVFPNAIAIPMSGDMTITQWHVPIDDTHCFWYSIFTSFDAPVDRAKMRAQRLERHTLPDYRPTAGRDNDWGYSPDEQATQTYTGMGMDINVHDQWAVESQGAIQDRTIEHLGRTDVAIIANRRLLRAAIQAAQQSAALPFRTPLAAPDSGPVAVDAIGGSELGEACWRALDAQRRDGAPWWAGVRA